jgi:hypothetical protein
MSKAKKPRSPRHLRLRHQVWHLRIQIDGKRRWRSTSCRDLKAAERRADEIKVELRACATRS